MWLGSQSEETYCASVKSHSPVGASKSAVRRRWLSLCTGWPSHSQWPSEQIGESASMRLPSYRHSFLASVLNRGEWLTSRPGRLYFYEVPPVPIEEEAGRVPERVWAIWWTECLLTQRGFESRTVEPVAWSLYQIYHTHSMKRTWWNFYTVGLCSFSESLRKSPSI